MNGFEIGLQMRTTDGKGLKCGLSHMFVSESRHAIPTTHLSHTTSGADTLHSGPGARAGARSGAERDCARADQLDQAARLPAALVLPPPARLAHRGGRRAGRGRPRGGRALAVLSKPAARESGPGSQRRPLRQVRRCYMRGVGPCLPVRYGCCVLAIASLKIDHRIRKDACLACY